MMPASILSAGEDTFCPNFGGPEFEARSRKDSVAILVSVARMADRGHGAPPRNEDGFCAG
jgi:hypothetical protein